MSAPFEDFDEGAGAQLVAREAGVLQGFGFGQCAGVEGAQKEVQETLAGGCVVEDVADQSCLAGFGVEIAEALARGTDAALKKVVESGVAGDELSRV